MHELKITARGVEINDHVREYLDSKIKKVSRLLKTNVEINCEIINIKTKIGLHKSFHVEVSMYLPKTYIKVTKEGQDILEVIDKIEPVLKRQISKIKGKSGKKKFHDKLSMIGF